VILMTNKKWSYLFGILIFLFTFIIPLAIVFLMYMSLDSTDSNVSMNIIGVFICVGLLFGFIKLIDRDCVRRDKLHRNPVVWLINLKYWLPPLAGTVLFTWFIYAVKGEIQTLWIVMFITSICEFIAFVLKWPKEHFDRLIESPPPTP